MAFNDLYQEIILEHSRHPRNRERLDHVPDSAIHENPTCGDSVKLDVEITPDGKIERVRFDGDGCAISTSSASMMTQILGGLSLEKAETLASDFIAIMRKESSSSLDKWGELAALQGVMDYPLRVKCATLPWHAFLDAVDNSE